MQQSATTALLETALTMKHRIDNADCASAVWSEEVCVSIADTMHLYAVQKSLNLHFSLHAWLSEEEEYLFEFLLLRCRSFHFFVFLFARESALFSDVYRNVAHCDGLLKNKIRNEKIKVIMKVRLLFEIK